MLKKIFTRHQETLPKSPTSMAINLIATFILICSFAVIKIIIYLRWKSAVFAMVALALPIIILEYIFLKTYNRPSTGLNFKIKNAANIKRITVKIVGLYGTIGFVALIYWLFPIYRSDFYDNYWIFIKYIALILLVGGIPYFIVLDRYLVEPCDSYWHFGMAVLGQWKKISTKIVRQHILGWVIKLFFLPLMFCSLVGNLSIIRTTDFSTAMSYFPSQYDYFYNLIFTVDLASERLGNFDFPHGGAECLEPLHDVADELREPVDGHGQLYQGIRPFLVEPFHPRRNRRRGHQERPGRLGQRPVAGRLQLDDGHAFYRWIVWPLVRWQMVHAGVLDPHLLPQPDDLLIGLIMFSLPPKPWIHTVRHPASGVYCRVLSQANYMDHRGFDGGGPTLGQRNSRWPETVGHSSCP